MPTAHQPLDINSIQKATRALSIPSSIIYLSTVDSTNRYLADLGTERLHHGLTVIAEFQSAGRGRQGRQWTAPACTSLLLSCALELLPSNAPQDIVMLSALAVADAIADVSSLATGLKWPNDVLVNGRKVCGILSEMPSHSGARVAILGIGLNVNVSLSDLKSLSPDATSLSVESGANVNREPLAIALFRRLDMWYRCLKQDPDAVFETWQKRLDTLDKPVVVKDAAGVWQGVATEVRRDGGLVVRRNDGETRVVYAADVSVRPFGGFTSVD